MNIVNKIKMVDNDLVTTIICEKNTFNELIEEDVLHLNKFSINKIKTFIKSKKAGTSNYIAFDFNKDTKVLKDVNHFIDLEIPKRSSNFYRVLLVWHETLNKNLDLLLSETVVIFSDDKLSLENI